jgi:hypothetical protein
MRGSKQNLSLFYKGVYLDQKYFLNFGATESKNDFFDLKFVFPEEGYF